VLKQIVFLDNNALDWFAEDDGKIYFHLPQKYYELYIISEVKYEFKYPRKDEVGKKIQENAERIISEYPIKIFKPFGLLSNEDIRNKKQKDPSNDEAHYGGWDEGFWLPNAVIDFLKSDLVKGYNEDSRKYSLRPTGLRKKQADIMLAALSTTYPVLTNDADIKKILEQAKKIEYKIVHLKKDIEKPRIAIHEYLTLNKLII
jgi:hypothetical protein